MPDRTSNDLGWGITIFDDLVAACGPVAFKYQEYFLEVMLQAINHNDPSVRQSASFGAGIMAQKGGPDFHPALKRALPCLLSVIQHPNCHEFGNKEATENAVSAILKICLVPEIGIPEQEYLPGVLGMLPFTEDQEEATFVYNHLCDLMLAHFQQYVLFALFFFFFLKGGGGEGRDLRKAPALFCFFCSVSLCLLSGSLDS